jgi:hypothetical protein
MGYAHAFWEPWCKSTIKKGGQPNNSNMHMLIQSMLYQEFMFLHGGNTKVKKSITVNYDHNPES